MTKQKKRKTPPAPPPPDVWEEFEAMTGDTIDTRSRSVGGNFIARERRAGH